jgi:hypothetical protein
MTREEDEPCQHPRALRPLLLKPGADTSESARVNENGVGLQHCVAGRMDRREWIEESTAIAMRGLFCVAGRRDELLLLLNAACRCCRCCVLLVAAAAAAAALGRSLSRASAGLDVRRRRQGAEEVAPAEHVQKRGAGRPELLAERLGLGVALLWLPPRGIAFAAAAAAPLLLLVAAVLVLFRAVGLLLSPPGEPGDDQGDAHQDEAHGAGHGGAVGAGGRPVLQWALCGGPRRRGSTGTGASQLAAMRGRRICLELRAMPLPGLRWASAACPKLIGRLRDLLVQGARAPRRDLGGACPVVTR